MLIPVPIPIFIPCGDENEKKDGGEINFRKHPKEKQKRMNYSQSDREKIFQAEFGYEPNLWDKFVISKLYYPLAIALSAVMILGTPGYIIYSSIKMHNRACENIYGIKINSWESLEIILPRGTYMSDFQEKPYFEDRNSDGLIDIVTHDKRNIYTQQPDGGFVRREAL